MAQFYAHKQVEGETG